MSILTANTSITHTFGNVTCVAFDYIKSFFEEDFFKTTHISTKMAYRQLNIFKTNQEFFKRNKPMLVLRPRIELDDDSLFLSNTAMTSSMNSGKLNTNFANTQELIKDDNHGAMLRYMLNRLKITFDIVMVFDTMNQQLDVAHALKNIIIPNKPFMINTPLESYIPKNLIYPMCDYLGIDRTDKQQVLQYLNTEAKMPITYKLKNASGNDEFFSLYNTNIEAIASPLTLDDGNKQGMVTDSFTITFSLSMEFYALGTYSLFLKDKKNNITHCGLDPDLNTKDFRVIPILTIPLVLDLKLPQGWKQYTNTMLTVSDQVKDETDISSLFTSSLNHILAYYKNYSLPLDSVIQFKLYEGVKELTEYKDYDIDVEGRRLVIYNGDHKLTYRLFIIINNYLINSMSAEITEFIKEK